MVGKIVRLIPKGLSVSSRVAAISCSSFSGEPVVSAVIMPRPPALDTAAANPARPTFVIPPHTTGCLIPSNSVTRVLKTGPSRTSDC